MTRILVLGAGSIGRLTATRLVAAGHDVHARLPLGQHVASRAPAPSASTSTDADATRAAVASVDVVVNAMNPPSYTTWDRDWPPVARSVQAAVEAAGTRLVLVGNLYAYGRVDAPMTERTPLRPNGHKGALRQRCGRTSRPPTGPDACARWSCAPRTTTVPASPTAPATSTSTS